MCATIFYLHHQMPKLHYPDPPSPDVEWMWWQHAVRTCLELGFGGGKGVGLADAEKDHIHSIALPGEQLTCATIGSTDTTVTTSP